MPRLLLPLLATLAACGPVDSGSPRPRGARADAILGGSPDATDTDVFLLELTLDGSGTALCSATLVSPRILLTAAHCVDPAAQSASTLTARAMNEPDVSALSTGDFTAATEVRLHPQWSASSPRSGYDLALLLLASPPPGVTPRQLSRITPRSGAPLRVIGYGRSSAGADDSGTRRSANVSITSVSSAHIDLGVLGSAGTCVGDSGGPALLRGTDGVERVAGVHSYGASQCGEGTDVRVDWQLSFIDTYLDQRDPPLCTADGRCMATGCAPADPDCVCVADGTCSAAYPDLLTDPDCPADCVANSACSAQPCPRPDPDCALDGDSCTSPAQCLNHQCLADARGFSFCSRSCTSSGECTRDMECRASVCRPPVVELKPADPVSGGCTSAGGLGPALLLLPGLLRRRRRPRAR